MSSFACVVCTVTVSCDSCKVFLKKRPTWTLKAARRKICGLWCLCVKLLISLSICWHFRIIYFKPGSFKSIKTDCLIQHISHVANSKMSEMSFALDKKKEKESFRRHFKDALDDCFNLERAVMISSQLPFVLFFFSEDTSPRQRLLRCALQLKLCQLLIWVRKTISKSLQHPLSSCCPRFQDFVGFFWRVRQSQGQFSLPLMTKHEIMIHAFKLCTRFVPITNSSFVLKVWNKIIQTIMTLLLDYKKKNNKNVFAKCYCSDPPPYTSALTAHRSLSSVQISHLVCTVPSVAEG